MKILALLLLLLAGCTSPQWWYNPDRGFLYRGYVINVASQWEVIQECEMGINVLGCVMPEKKAGFTVNNPYAMWHECRHVDKLQAGDSEASEVLVDLAMIFSGFNDTMLALTWPFPAMEDCGEGTMARWSNGKTEIVNTRWQDIRLLEVVKEKR